jgi:hypothetical protein
MENSLETNAFVNKTRSVVLPDVAGVGGVPIHGI